jgi:ribosome-associated translation inhibitor RaiA
MIIPVQITFRNVASTSTIEEQIRARVQKLERFYSLITSCRVLVEAPARHREKGYSFHIRIDLTVPEGEIVVKREPTLHGREQDMAEDPRSFSRGPTPAAESRPPKASGRENARAHASSSCDKTLSGRGLRVY